MDFSNTANDYSRYRAGFPDALFVRLSAFGVGKPGQQIVDLGTGTGALARGLARQGAKVTGVDIGEVLMQQAERLDREAGVTIQYRVARAEQTGLPSGAFDVVSAAQCWHWFDRPAAAAEARRLLSPGGFLILTHFEWLTMPGNVPDVTAALIDRYNPAQPKHHLDFAAGTGVYNVFLHDIAGAGFVSIETFSFDVMVPYTHEAWRGRVRASAVIGVSLPPQAVERFDQEHAAMLRQRFPEDPFSVPHRVFAIVARAPA
jgi:ubiquinone/menaquinone biosynthesis C-methylase UbiE